MISIFSGITDNSKLSYKSSTIWSFILNSLLFTVHCFVQYSNGSISLRDLILPAGELYLLSLFPGRPEGHFILHSQDKQLILSGNPDNIAQYCQPPPFWVVTFAPPVIPLRYVDVFVWRGCLLHRCMCFGGNLVVYFVKYNKTTYINLYIMYFDNIIHNITTNLYIFFSIDIATIYSHRWC